MKAMERTDNMLQNGLKRFTHHPAPPTPHPPPLHPHPNNPPHVFFNTSNSLHYRLCLSRSLSHTLCISLTHPVSLSLCHSVSLCLSLLLSLSLSILLHALPQSRNNIECCHYQRLCALTVIWSCHILLLSLLSTLHAVRFTHRTNIHFASSTYSILHVYVCIYA